MSSSRSAFSGLKPKTLPMIEADQIGDRARLEQVEVVGDVGEVLARRVRHRIDPVGLRPVLLAGRQAVGPNHRPGRGRGFAGHGRRRLDRVDAVLRRDAEQRDDVGVLRLVVGLPIAHLLVFHDAGSVAVLAGHGFGLVGHGTGPFVVLLDRRSGGLGGCDLRVELAGGIASGHLVHRHDPDLRGIASRPKRSKPVAAEIAHRIHRRLQEFARVELARVLRRRSGGTGRSSPCGSRCRC